MASRTNRNLPWVWNPPCCGLYVNVTWHQGQGTKGSAHFWSLEGRVGSGEPLAASYTSDATTSSLEALEDVLQTLLKQIHRQQELRAAID